MWWLGLLGPLGEGAARWAEFSKPALLQGRGASPSSFPRAGCFPQTGGFTGILSSLFPETIF